MPHDRWTAIDFETATSSRDSACALGLTVIEGGEIVESRYWLIRPPGNFYSHWNMRVHGIHPADTEDAPRFSEIYDELRPYVDGQHLIAHNAPFDVSVMRGCLDLYGLDAPKAGTLCSCRLARRAFPGLENHKLPTVCDRCNIELDHHDAASDARAAALVALRCRDAVGADTIHAAARQLGVELGRL